MFMTEVYAVTECRTIINTTGATSGAGTAYPSEDTSLPPVRFKIRV
jgi:hypothetical protein